jgi:hypothetical protein
MAKKNLRYVPYHESHYYIKLEPHQHHRADAFTHIKGDDGWDHVYYLANAIMDSTGNIRPPEYVYILVNRSVPNMVKIGMTTTNPTKRAQEISKATGVPTPWVPIYEFRCYRSDLLEREVHDHFKEHRVNKDREMFSIDTYTAQRAIEELGYKYSTVLWEHKTQGK